MILAQDLEGLAFRSLGIAGKRIEPRLSGCHFRLCGRDVMEPSPMRPTAGNAVSGRPAKAARHRFWGIFNAEPPDQGAA